jgi:hypothetical protein
MKNGPNRAVLRDSPRRAEGDSQALSRSGLSCFGPSGCTVVLPPYSRHALVKIGTSLSIAYSSWRYEGAWTCGAPHL